LFTFHETRCICHSEEITPDTICNGVNLISNTPISVVPPSVPAVTTVGFSFRPLVNLTKITSLLFPIIIWTGSGDTREYGIWNSDTQELLLQGTINRLTDTTDGGFYVKKLDPPFELNKNILYVYGALLGVGDEVAAEQISVYTNPGLFEDVVVRVNEALLNTLTYPEADQDDKIITSFFRYSLNVGC
jgi:hypothetical protein